MSGRKRIGAAAAFVAVALTVAWAASAKHASGAPPDAPQIDRWLHQAADADDVAAENALEKWAARGDPGASQALVRLLSHRPDAASAAHAERLLETASRGGDPWAATELADRSLRRLGPPDAAASNGATAGRLRITELYRQGAAAGLPRAQRMLGVLLLDGSSGGTLDPTTARAWLEKAAVGGDAYAMFLLANALRAGHGGPRDEARALAWYRRAADADFAPALQSLALAYRYGELGLPVDSSQERLLDHEAAEALSHSHAGS